MHAGGYATVTTVLYRTALCSVKNGFLLLTFVDVSSEGDVRIFQGKLERFLGESMNVQARQIEDNPDCHAGVR